MFYRCGLLHAEEEQGPSCAEAFVEAVAGMQQPVAVLGVRLEFAVCIWVAFIEPAVVWPPLVSFGSVGLRQQRVASQKPLRMGQGEAGGFGC